MSVQIDQVPRAVNDGTGMTFTLGAGNPGGGIGVRVLIDDTIVLSAADAALILEAIQERIMSTKTWPVS
jgi:hypothetical protein